MIHHIRVTTTDSIKNCVMISLFNAQIAFLIQISLVLSVTETNAPDNHYLRGNFKDDNNVVRSYKINITDTEYAENI